MNDKKENSRPYMWGDTLIARGIIQTDIISLNLSEYNTLTQAESAMQTQRMNIGVSTNVHDISLIHFSPTKIKHTQPNAMVGGVYVERSISK